LLFGTDWISTPQMNLRKRRNCIRGVRFATNVECYAERVLKQCLGLFGLTQEEVESTEVVKHPADVAAICDLLVVSLGLLGIPPSADPVSHSLSDQGGLEVHLG